MIIDATYTDEEYNDPNHSKVGWGHSTWQQAVKIAQQPKLSS
jgi:ribonuclease BN (tRNA processing enzyme)